MFKIRIKNSSQLLIRVIKNQKNIFSFNSTNRSFEKEISSTNSAKISTIFKDWRYKHLLINYSRNNIVNEMMKKEK